MSQLKNEAKEDCEYVAEWERTRPPFQGVWRVRKVPGGMMISCTPEKIWAPTREGIKEILHGMGNHHPVRFLD